MKLIRNKLALIPKEGVSVGQVPTAGPVHLGLLAAKLHEEASEVADRPTDVTEYGDLLEVAFQIAHYHGISEDAIYAAMLRKRAERGGFGHGYYMVRL